MNILITTSFGQVAGSTYSLFYLARGLKEKGHHVILGIPFGTKLHALAISEDIQVINIPFRFKVDLDSMRIIKNVVNELNIDLINPQESKDRYNVIFSKLLFGFEAKIILTRRQRVADNNFFKRWLHVKFSEKIVVVSYGLQQLVQRKGFPIEHTYVIHNGIPINEIKIDKTAVEKLKSKYDIGDGEVVIGCVARLKRQDILVKTLSFLPENWKLLLVGIDKKSFVKKFPNVNIKTVENRLIMTGLIDEKSQVLNHYPLMNVHVLPSQMDGFGLVLLEAMAIGIPVIGSDYGGIPDVIEHGVSGYLFDNNKPEQLAKYIQVIVDDSAIREKFTKNGIQRVNDKFTISNTVNNYEKFFNSIISSP